MKLRHARKRLKLRTYNASAWIITKLTHGKWVQVRQTFRRLNSDHGMALVQRMVLGDTPENLMYLNNPSLKRAPA